MPFQHSIPDYLLIADLLGFGTGAVMSVILVLLVRRAARRTPGMPLLAFCSLLWNFGGLTTTILIFLGMPPHSLPVNVVRATFLTAGVIFPLSLLSLWSSPLPAGSWQTKVNRWLRPVAVFNAIWITILLFACALLPNSPYYRATMYAVPFNDSILLTIAAFTLLRGRLSAAADQIYLALTLMGIWGASIAILSLDYSHFSPRLEALIIIAKEQSPFLAVLGSLFFFARFRSADVLIKSSLRVVAAVCLALWACFFLAQTLPALAQRLGPFPAAALTALGTATIAALILSFFLLDRAIVWAVDHWVLRQPDYRAALRQIWNEMAHLDSEPDLFAAVDRIVAPLLEIASARVWPRGDVPGIESHAESNAGEFWELSSDDPCRYGQPGGSDVELLVPVRVHGNVTHVIGVAPGPCRRSLLNKDLKFLYHVATQIGSRLEVLAYERERLDRQSREARLRHLATEAELKALRAQINPHFLFNSLNTVADLIVTDPAKAEAMTVLLAKVFRHLLMHGDRQLTRVSEEMDFLRTYLSIEEVRFGERLRVRMDVDPAVSKENIPSLILQPVVENAIKHGLAPKIGGGNLSITANRDGDFVRLAVEDDGVGPAPVTIAADERRNGGLGLKIIAERLKTLYNGRASLHFESAAISGSRVTILIPRGETATLSG